VNTAGTADPSALHVPKLCFAFFLPCSTQVDKDGARKELVLSERQARLTEGVQRLQPGQTVRGQVLRLEDYGALVAIYGADGRPSGVQGLLHKSEMSWDVVMTVDSIVTLGAHTYSSGPCKAQ
jgi:polyribonucleotide nucleotidyltransferase